MKFAGKREWAVVVAAALLTVSQAYAQQHVVPLTELQSRVQTASEERSKNIADIERVLSYPAAVKALEKSGVKQDQVRTAVATLSSDELARLAQTARASEQDVQGGFIVGILALIGLIVVILIVIAVVADARPAPSDSPLPANGGVEDPSSISQIAPVHG